MNTTVHFEVSPFVVNNKPTNIKKEMTVDKLHLLEDQQEVPAGYGLFRILHQDFGDKRLIWDASDFAQISEARQMFKDLVSQGFVPYIIDKKTGEPTQMPMAEFNPLAEEVFMEDREIIMAPVQNAVAG